MDKFGWDWLDERLKISSRPRWQQIVAAVLAISLALLPSIFLPSRPLESIFVAVAASAVFFALVWVFVIVCHRFGLAKLMEWTMYGLILLLILVPLIGLANLFLGQKPPLALDQKTMDWWSFFAENNLLNLLLILAPIGGFLAIRTMFSKTAKRVTGNINAFQEEADEIAQKYGIKPIQTDMPIIIGIPETDRMEGEYMGTHITLERRHNKQDGRFFSLQMPIQSSFFMEVSMKRNFWSDAKIMKNGKPALTIDGDSSHFDELIAAAPEIAALFDDKNSRRIKIEPGKLTIFFDYDDESTNDGLREHIRRIAPIMIEGALKLADAAKTMK